MAGLATRFVKEGIFTPKPLIRVNNKTLIEHSLESLGLEGRYIFITRKFDNEEYNRQLSLLLKSLCPESVEICLESATNSSVETCLSAIDLIDDGPLVITNCDQRTEWDSESFINHLKENCPDGCVVTHKSDNPKHSYAQAETNRIVKIEEKNVISNLALIGVHYWKNGKDFINSARKLLESNKEHNKKESYISETYNYLISDGKRITYFSVGENEYIPLGTPYDLSIYEAMLHEYDVPKPKTLFIDLDGTIFKHCHRYSDLNNEPELLPGVLDKFNQWDSQGNKIILCSARKESARKMTESWLQHCGVPYDQLILGLTTGTRIIINDFLTKDSKERAKAINVITNRGIKDIDWGTFGL